jgi:hypothetical protein
MYWFDWNGDGDFNDALETVDYGSVIVGSHSIGIAVPLGATGSGGYVQSRFRLYASEPSAKTVFGYAAGGEVEDYAWPIAATFARISGFNAYLSNGQVVVKWETNAEVKTIGFYLQRQIAGTEAFEPLNDGFLPGLLNSPQGGTYSYIDASALPGQPYTYELVEIEADGKENVYGPYTVIAARELPKQLSAIGGQSLKTGAGGYYREARGLTVAKRNIVKPKYIYASKSSMQKQAAASASLTPLKIAVAQRGIHAVSAAEIASLTGASEAAIKKMLSSCGLTLAYNGRALNYFVNGNGLMFYSDAVNSLYSTENVYWLSAGKSSCKKLAPIEAEPKVSGVLSFADKLHVEEDRYAASSVFFDPKADFWLWDYIVSGYASYGSKNFTVQTHGVASAEHGVLVVNLQGASNTAIPDEHHVVVNLNGVKIGEGRWDGLEPYVLELEFDHSLLHEGANTVNVTGLLDTGAPYSVFYIDSFDIGYQRRYQAANNELVAPGVDKQNIKIDGFTGIDIHVFDISNSSIPKQIKTLAIENNGGNFAATFGPTYSNSKYLALTAATFKQPSFIEAVEPSNLRDKNNKGDYLIITPAELKDAVQALADYRQGQGLTPFIVELEDIFNEFAYGNYNPQAIKDFIAYAAVKWQTPPAYVLLVGEGTYDYKNIMGTNDNLMPTMLAGTYYGLFPADNQYVDTQGNDHVPEIPIGRLPVVSATELQTVIGKIIAYESTGGSGKHRVLMMADNADIAGDFPADSDELAATVPLTHTVKKVYLSHLSINQARDAVMSSINNGVGLANYIGHSGVIGFADEGLLTIGDMGLLNNGNKLPIVTAMTCVIGQYAIPGFDALGEALVLRNGGGATAVLAPTGLSFNADAMILNRILYNQYFYGNRARIGDVLLGSFQENSITNYKQYIFDIYSFLGDPAMTLQ